MSFCDLQAILSTTAKARDRAKKKAEAKAGGKPETGAAGPSAGVKPAGDGPSAMETDAAPGKEGGAAAAGADAAAAAATAKKDEPTSFTMENPARVVPAQVRASCGAVEVFRVTWFLFLQRVQLDVVKWHDCITAGR